MQFIIKQISPSRKEIRIAIDSTYIDDLDAYTNPDRYILGSVNGHFDNGTIDPKYIPPTSGFAQNAVHRPANLDYSRKILNFIKEELINGDDKFEYLFEKDNFYSPIINVSVDRLSFFEKAWAYTPELYTEADEFQNNDHIAGTPKPFWIDNFKWTCIK